MGTAWNNLYLLAFPGSMHCYVADGGQQTAPSNTERSGYEWYYWENIPARCFLVVDNVLFFGTPDGKVCRFCDSLADTNGNDVSAIPAVWATSANQLYSQARTKYIERRGCIFNLTHNAQSFKVAIVTDARKLQADRQTELTPYDDGLDYNIFALTHKSDEEHSDRKGIEAAPYYCINKPIKRFDYVQFVIRNDNAGEDLGVYSIEYQYRYGRYLK